MKKYFFFAIAAIGMIAGCQKNQIDPTPVEDGTPVPVKFGVSAPAVEITKAAVDSWASQSLYIYGINRAETDFTNELFIDNVMVAAPANGMSGEIIPQHEVNGTTEAYYYSATNTTYDFYGYYVDTACGAGEPVPTVAADAIYLPITIDGSQDIMLAKADQVADAGTTVAPERAYSAYSARKGVTPKLVFEHMLARFDFNVIAGDDDAVDNVIISNVTIADAAVKGQLNIVGANRGVEVDATAEKDDLALAATPTAPTSTTTKTPLGASLMVFPGMTEYALDFDLEQTGIASPIVSDPINLNVASFKDASGNAHTVFTAGYKYTVTIKVYSNRPVEIIAELSEWKEAGEYEYDPDNEWETPAIPTTPVDVASTTAVINDEASYNAFYAGSSAPTFDQAQASGTLPWAGFKVPAEESDVTYYVKFSYDGVQKTFNAPAPRDWYERLDGNKVAKITLPAGKTIISFEAVAELGLDASVDVANIQFEVTK